VVIFHLNNIPGGGVLGFGDLLSLLCDLPDLWPSLYPEIRSMAVSWGRLDAEPVAEEEIGSDEGEHRGDGGEEICDEVGEDNDVETANTAHSNTYKHSFLNLVPYHFMLLRR
jgi:hypothetical protein